MQLSIATRKRIILLVIGSILLIAFYIISTHGILSIQINKKTTLTIQSTGGTKKIHNDVVSSNFVMKNNTYQVYAEDAFGNKSMSVVDVKPLKKTTVELNIEDKHVAYPVFFSSLRYVHTLSSGTYIGINSETGRVVTVTNSGVKDIQYRIGDGGGNNLQEMHSLANGVFLAYGRQGDPPMLVKKESGEIVARFVTLPGDSEKILVGMNPGNESFWVSNQTDSYLYTYPYDKPSKSVPVGMESYEALISSRDSLLFTSNVETVSDNPRMKLDGSYKTYLYDVNSKSGQTLDASYISGQWAPGGDFVALINSQTNRLDIYARDGSFVNQVGSPSGTLIHWLSDDSLFFTKDMGLWRYNLHNNISTLFTEIVGDPTSVTKINGGVFITSSANNGDPSVWLVSDKGADQKLTQLGKKLPITTTNYSLSYSYIGSPKINALITVPLNGTTPGRIALYNQDVAKTKQEIQSKLQELGLGNMPIDYITDSSP